jgi:hypothetical protein
MILTGENRNTRRETSLRATLFAINPRWSGLGLSPWLCGDGSAATDHLSGNMPSMHGNDPLVTELQQKETKWDS